MDKISYILVVKSIIDIRKDFIIEEELIPAEIKCMDLKIWIEQERFLAKRRNIDGIGMEIID